MHHSCLCKLFSFFLVVLSLTSIAAAQDSWDRLASLGQGTKVVVERSIGGRVKGRFALATADTLSVESGGRRVEIAKADVTSVHLTRRSSRVKRGLIGALAGAGAGVLVGVVAGVAGKADPLVPAGGFLIGIPAGAAIGAAMGGSKKGELVYRR